MRPNCQPGCAEDWCVIGPRRRSDPHRWCPVGPGEKFGGQSQRAGAAWGLDPGNAPIGDHRRAQRHWSDQIGKGLVAFGAAVALGVLFCNQPCFGSLYRTHDRSSALRIAVDANTEIDLVGARIGPVQTDDGQESVGWLAFEVTEQGRRGFLENRAHDVACLRACACDPRVKTRSVANIVSISMSG